MSDNCRYNNCGQTWIEAAHHPLHDYAGKVEAGDVVPISQCPNLAYQVLCYPAYGYIYDLEQQSAVTRQQLSALHDIVSQLLDWAQLMGEWEAPV